jgi:hypothetical protein
MHRAVSSRLLAAVLLLCPIAVGCHRGGAEPDPYSPDKIALIKTRLQYRRIVVPPPTVAKIITEPEQHPQTFHAAMLGGMGSKNIFDSVAGDPKQAAQPGTLVVECNIEDMRIVGGGARFWGGAMAGNSLMYINVTLKDGMTGAVIAKNDFRSDNNAYAAAWTGGASDRSLPQDMAGIVSDWVIERAQQPGPAGVRPAAPAAPAAPATPTAAPAAQPQPGATACTKDTECQGDLICIRGFCATPKK